MDRSTRAVLDGDLDALREVYAADVVVTTPDSGTLHGIEQLLEWNRSFVDAFSDRDHSSQRSLETQDCAIHQGDFRGTHTRPLQLPDGQQVPPRRAAAQRERCRCPWRTAASRPPSRCRR